MPGRAMYNQENQNNKVQTNEPKNPDTLNTENAPRATRINELIVNETVIKMFSLADDNGVINRYYVKYGNVVTPPIKGKRKLKPEKYNEFLKGFLFGPEGNTYKIPTDEQVIEDVKKLDDIINNAMSEAANRIISSNSLEYKEPMENATSTSENIYSERTAENTDAKKDYVSPFNRMKKKLFGGKEKAEENEKIKDDTQAKIAEQERLEEDEKIKEEIRKERAEERMLAQGDTASLIKKQKIIICLLIVYSILLTIAFVIIFIENNVLVQQINGL